jgi:hypothetical protein
VRTAKGSVLPIRDGAHNTEANQFFLQQHENFTCDDDPMVVFHIALWDKTVVFDLLFRKEVNGIVFL